MSIIYEVFARKEHPAPLTYVGSVEVDNADDVEQASLAAYGPQSEWLEMVAVPREAVILVFSEHKEPQ